MTGTLVPMVVDPLAISDQELRVIKDVLNPDLSEPELRLFAIVAKRSGLDPFAKQIFAVKRKGRVTFQTSQEGYLSIAERTGEYDGCDEPEYGPGQGIPVHPEWATVRVYRKGMARGVAATAYWNEYYPGDEQGYMWRKMPRVMLAKVARVAALRLAFPYVYADLYSEDEMAQAGPSRVVDTETGEILPAGEPALIPEPPEHAPHPVAETPPAPPPTEPWLDVPNVTLTGVVSFGTSPVDGHLRETPTGQLFGFKLACDDGTKVPQVVAQDALALAAASESSLAKQTVTVHGDIWRVPWDKNARPMPAFQRLILTRLETPAWTIPAPIDVSEAERPAEAESAPLSASDTAELEALEVPWDRAPA
jgi:phage recombination protein Bet